MGTSFRTSLWDTKISRRPFKAHMTFNSEVRIPQKTYLVVNYCPHYALKKNDSDDDVFNYLGILTYDIYEHIITGIMFSTDS